MRQKERLLKRSWKSETILWIIRIFGKKLLTELNTPVGLIRDAWGGSPIEAWMTVEAAKVVPEVAKRDAETSEKLRAYPERRKKYLEEIAIWAKENQRQDSEHKLPGTDAKWQKMRSVDVNHGIICEGH